MVLSIIERFEEATLLAFLQEASSASRHFRQFWLVHIWAQKQKMAVEGTKKNLGTSLLIVSAVLAPALATLPDARPPYVTRTFHSTAVDDYISEVRNV
jgi:hypothetical protein